MPARNNSGNVMRWLQFPAQWQICVVTTAYILDNHQLNWRNQGMLHKGSKKGARPWRPNGMGQGRRHCLCIVSSDGNPSQCHLERGTMSGTCPWAADSGWAPYTSSVGHALTFLKCHLIAPSIASTFYFLLSCSYSKCITLSLINSYFFVPLVKFRLYVKIFF